ncbi:MAG: PQQ-dependent sugar dehydrogenase [Anaerolineae bacterium]
MRKLWVIILILILSAVLALSVNAAPAAQAPVPPVPANYKFTTVATGLTKPVLITHAGDNSGRLFIVEQSGKIKILQNGSVLPTAFLDMSTLVSTGNEQGLLGLAFHPNFAQNVLLYVCYTDTNGDTVLARYNVNTADPNTVNTATRTPLFFVDQPYSNHNGGHIAFGPDGFLYMGLGDGGSGGDPQNYAQTTNPATNPNVQQSPTRINLGKMLRFDVSAVAFQPQIFAIGLRNPWRWSFDRLTGDMYIGDVGQGNWEEVDFWPANGGAGANFGWKVYEGNHSYSGGSLSGTIFPFAEYDHASGCSVTGGYVYRGSQLAALQGVYFFADYCSGNIWSSFRDGSDAWQTALFKTTSYNISSFGQDQTGELYVVNLGGNIVRLDSNVATPVPATATPLPPNTNTPVPPTLTNTPVPPSATPIPSNTAVPPTATFTPTTTDIPPSATLEPTLTVIPPSETPLPTQPSLNVDVLPGTGDIGETVLVMLNLRGVSNLYGLQVDCQVNPAVLGGTGLVEGDGFNSSTSFIANKGYQPDGSWTVGASRLLPNPAISGDTLAFTLNFIVLASGSGDVTCAALAVDQNGNELPLTVVNGSFTGNGPVVTDEPTVEPTATNTPEPTLEPTATNTPPPTPVPDSSSVRGVLAFQSRTDQSGIKVELYTSAGQFQGETMSASDGSFAFPNVPAGDYVVQASADGHLAIQVAAPVTNDGQGYNIGFHELKAGDTDGNQIIDLADAVFIGGNFNISAPPAPNSVDLNGDGIVNIRDLVLVGGNYGLAGPIVE